MAPTPIELIAKICREFKKLIQLATGFNNRLTGSGQEAEKNYLQQVIQLISTQTKALQATEHTAEANNHYEAIHQLLKTLVAQEIKTRQNCAIGESRLKVLQTQLTTLLAQFEKDTAQVFNIQKEEAAATHKTPHTTVYVYLFNTQGSDIKTWQNLLLPEALVEHSVNRPVYADEEQVENVIRAKPNKTKLAYLEVEINKADILQPSSGQTIKDQHGYPLLRLRQGALKAENVTNFVHNDVTYHLFDGNLIATDNYCELDNHPAKE